MENSNSLFIPSSEEIIEINRAPGYVVMNRGNIDFLISKILSKYRDKEFKKQIAKIAAIIWTHLIQAHPFSDGN